MTERKCLRCGKPVPVERSVYCSDRCQEDDFDEWTFWE